MTQRLDLISTTTKGTLITVLISGLAACKPAAAPVLDTTILPGIVDIERAELSEKGDTVIVSQNTFGDPFYLVFERPPQGVSPVDLAETYRQTLRSQGWKEEDNILFSLFKKPVSPECTINVMISDIDLFRPIKTDWTADQLRSVVFDVVIGENDCPSGIDETSITSRYNHIEDLTE